MRKFISDKSGFIFVAVLGFMIIMLMTSAAYFFTRKLDFQVAINREDALQAFNLAESGMHHMLDYAYQKPEVITNVQEGQPFNLPSSVYYNGLGGQYKSYLERLPGQFERVVKLRAVGEATVGKITKKVAMYFDIVYPFGHAIMVGDELRIDSGIETKVFGDVVYKRATGGTSTIKLQKGGMVQLSKPPIPIPVFEKYMSLPEVKLLNLSVADFTGGQKYDGIYYVKGGHAYIHSNTIINGTIIADKDVWVDGGAHINPDQSKGYPAIVAQGSVNINGDNSKINGLVYGNDLHIRGKSVMFNGGIIAKSRIHFHQVSASQVRNNEQFRPPFFWYSADEGRPYSIVFDQWTDEVN